MVPGSRKQSGAGYSWSGTEVKPSIALEEAVRWAFWVFSHAGV